MNEQTRKVANRTLTNQGGGGVESPTISMSGDKISWTSPSLRVIQLERTESGPEVLNATRENSNGLYMPPDS